MKVALLTAGKDPHYALGLAPALANAGIELEVVGDSEMETFPRLRHPNIQFFNLIGDRPTDSGIVEKVRRVLFSYARLLHFSWRSQSDIFHVLWPNKFVLLDRTILNFYYRILGKKLAITAHNVNTEARDRRDSALNRLSLRIQYNLMSHIFVHTSEMQTQLKETYGVGQEKITVLTFPINNVTPRTDLTREAARLAFGIASSEKLILFFGNIAPYKGLDDLIHALPQLRLSLGRFRLLVAGNVKKGEESYIKEVRSHIDGLGVADLVDQHIEYIPEEKVEFYFKAADLLVLPYRRIFQSGVLFLSYSFGLPVVVTDAGSLRDEVVEGKTGFVSHRNDVADLTAQIDRYFKSDLFAELETRRPWIINHANQTYSWSELANRTRSVYESLLSQSEVPVSNASRSD